MKVILLEDIKGFGKKGEVLDAKDGHARNYLIPRKLAVEATKGNMNQLEQKQKAEEKRLKETYDDAAKLKGKIEKAKVKIEVKTGESGKMFGSVTNKEIAEALEQQTGINVDRKKINLDEPIKIAGDKEIEIKLHPQVVAMLKLEIV